jgi:hypothetical protein
VAGDFRVVFGWWLAARVTGLPWFGRTLSTVGNQLVPAEPVPPGLRATRCRKARRTSWCPVCSRMVRPGDLIAKVGAQWEHATCAIAVAQAARGRPVATVEVPARLL